MKEPNLLNYVANEPGELIRNLYLTLSKKRVRAQRARHARENYPPGSSRAGSSRAGSASGE